jgi:hypothetical protein
MLLIFRCGGDIPTAYTRRIFRDPTCMDPIRLQPNNATVILDHTQDRRSALGCLGPNRVLEEFELKLPCHNAGFSDLVNVARIVNFVNNILVMIGFVHIAWEDVSWKLGSEGCGKTTLL